MSEHEVLTDYLHPFNRLKIPEICGTCGMDILYIDNIQKKERVIKGWVTCEGLGGQHRLSCTPITNEADKEAIENFFKNHDKEGLAIKFDE